MAISGLAVVSSLRAQMPNIDFPAASPACTLKQRVGLTDITVVYSRPSVKGRTIFGGIVPYGEVWRAGANQATKISFSTSVKLEGNEIPAGNYSLFATPAKQEWTIIISKNVNQWGAFQYTNNDDLVRFPVTPVSIKGRQRRDLRHRIQPHPRRVGLARTGLGQDGGADRLYGGCHR